MNKGVKFFSIIMTLAMLVMLWPAAAYGAEGDPPVLLEAVVNDDGHVELTFDKAMAAPEGGTAGFTVTGSKRSKGT